MSLIHQTAVVIPAYMPDDRLPPYVAALKEAGVQKIIIVDDGSGQSFQSVFDRIPEDGISHVIHYEPNGGKGVALRTGLKEVLEHTDCQYIVTADADGQHTVADVLRIVDTLEKDSHCLWLGSRNFSQHDVPIKSRLGNRITSVVFKLLYGPWVSDTQTGLRGFSREHLPLMTEISGDRYEYEMNVLIVAARKNIEIKPLTIQTVYENNNAGSHFRAVRDSARIYATIFGGLFKFASSSVISFLVDYGLYLLFLMLLKKVPGMEEILSLGIIRVVKRIGLATGGARIISGICNFLLNRQFVFSSKMKMRRSFPRYLAVFFLNMALSALLVSGVHMLTGLSDSFLKIPIDLLLFMLSYTLQRKWVFAPERVSSEQNTK